MTETIEIDTEYSFIRALSKRIESLLPSHTGRSIEEVELDQQFQITRNLLLDNNNRNPKIITYIFITFASILKSINTESANNKIKHRDEKSRNSTLLMCKLLADILKSNWDREQTTLDDKDLLSNYSRFCYYDPPNPVDPSVVPELVDIFINMLSSGVVRKVLSLVRNEQTIATMAVAKEEQEISREDQPLTKEEEIASSLSDIDWYLDTIIRYLATANPGEYYNVLTDKIFKYSEKEQTIPLPILQKYCPLVKYFFFSQQNHVRMPEDTLRALPNIKSITWRQVYLYFLANTIKDQSFSRILDYNALVDPANPHQIQLIKNLFDTALNVYFESSSNTYCGSYVMTWLLAVCIDDIQEFVTDKPINKLKLTFNKRLKFMMTVLKDSNNAANLECFDALIHTFHLGTRLQAYNLLSHPVYIFSLKFLEDTHRNLIKYAETHKEDLITDDELAYRYEFLTVNFYLSALLLHPDKYTKTIINNYNQNMDDLKANKILVKIIKGLSEIETAKKIFLKLMNQLTPTLKRMIYGALKILSQYEERYNRNVISPVTTRNDLSESSIFSDLASMDQENMTNVMTQMTMSSIKTSLDHYAEDLFDTQSRDSSRYGGLKNVGSTTASSHLSSSTYRFRIINEAEELLSDIFQIFSTVPDLYFNSMPLMSDEYYQTKPLTELLPAIMKFCHEAIIPLRLALKSRWVVQGNTRLLDSTKALCLKMISRGSRLVQLRTNLTVFANFNICNCIIYVTCEACLSISLLSPKFKSCFLFLNDFLQKRRLFNDIIADNPIVVSTMNKDYYEPCGDVIHAVEKVLLLSLCTHDISFYNYALQGIRWYITELEEHSSFYRVEEVSDTLLDSFKQFAKDDSVFTGFASLHKRHRNILREAKSTKTLYEVWLMIYYRWLQIVEKRDPLGAEENLIFKHYTGFIVSTSGCFISSNPFPENSELRQRSLAHITDLFDKCIALLTSPDMVVQMVIKEALSNESHPELYRLTAEKLMNTAAEFFDRYKADEIVLFLDRALLVMTAMINVKSEGALYLAAMLPQICHLFIKCISSIENHLERLKIQLRFCRLGSALEADRMNCGLNGAYKLRNTFAKSSMEWLEQAIFFDEAVQEDTVSTISRDIDTSYLALDLAVESSNLLRGQVENLLLEVPDGIKDDELNKYKDLAFSTYFSLFYKIIQKYTKITPNSRERHKYQVIIDNVLQSITNILQYDNQIGMRFILPMGYHENKKIRAIFLNVFSKMLFSQSLNEKHEEYPDELIQELTEEEEIFGAIADCASSYEHNLLASSLFGVFAYAGKLNKLFKVLLSVEVAHLTRSTDLFRRNSTLTKFLSFYAHSYGTEYLDKVIQPITKDLVDNDVQFEVEKVDTPETADIFMSYFNRIVDLIVDSADELPMAFKWLCGEVYTAVLDKFPDSALSAVSSFIFLRFVCPAIISPEQQFQITITNPKVKRSLMQLVKLLQNMANGTLSSIKWPALSEMGDQLKDDNSKICEFLRRVSTCTSSTYEFQKENATVKPLSELRYLHKFIYTYFTKIRLLYLFKDGGAHGSRLHEKGVKFKKFDLVVMKLGEPKPSTRLQLHTNLKLPDSNNLDEEEIKFNDFMTKMSLKYADTPPDAIDVIHSSIFKDGTPAVVVNLKKMNTRPDDAGYLVYKLLETVSQVWDNKFYLVYDFTDFNHYTKGTIDEFTSLVSNCSGKQMFSNCQRVYYFNIPRIQHPGFMNAVKAIRSKGTAYETKTYTYSLADPDYIIRNLCLDQETTSINRENKVSYDNVLLYEPTTESFIPVKVKIGRRFVTLCFKKKVPFVEIHSETDGFIPVEVYRISEFVKCEVSNYTGNNDEFTMYLNQGLQVTLRSQNRLEILRFLYFTISRLPKEPVYLTTEMDYQNERHAMHWFGRLYNIVFQGLLNNDEELKSKAASLFGSLSTYFGIDFGIRESHAVTVPFPADATNFVVSVSEYLANHFPQMTYRFFKAFFDNFERIDTETRFTSILYLSPWIQNIYEYVYLSDENGADKAADLFRLFCRLTAIYKDQIPFINDYIWSKLFQEARLVLTLVEEVVAFAIESKNDGPDWSFIIAVIRPSIEVCGEVTSRLTKKISVTLTTDSTVALESKLFEISVLIKICSSLFFNSYNLSKTYLAELIFFVTLFIDDCHLDVGEDLQKLLMTAIQSLLHKPGITELQQQKIDEAIAYFSTPRAKMIFGTNRDSANANDIGQTFNRISNFERLTDYLNDFIEIFGATDDKTNWRARWSSKAIDVGFNNYSLFQDRAVLVVGILAKQGISDSTACRTIKLVSNGALHSIKLAICVAVSVARILDGLPDNSILPPIVIWPQMGFALLNHSVLYQAGLLNVIASITKVMRSDPNYLDRIFEERQLLEPALSELEKRNNYSITKENFGMHVFFILTQGLRVSQYRHLSITCIKSYFKERFRQDIGQDVSMMDECAYAYLMLLYLCCDSKEVEEFYNEVGLPCEFFDLGDGQKMPKLLLVFLDQNNAIGEITMIHTGFFFSDVQGVDISFKERFIRIYIYLLEHSRESALLIYHIILPTMIQDLVNTVSIAAVKNISKTVELVGNNPDYDAQFYTDKVDKILKDNDIEVLKKLRNLKPLHESIDEKFRFRPEFDRDIKSIQSMLYRAASSHVIGSRLED